jgi:hypothetical protein
VTSPGVCSVAGGLKEIFWFFSELQTEVIVVEIVKMTTESSNSTGCASFISVQTMEKAA